MYCEGSEPGVKEWVATVQRLRYKDYQLAVKPAEKQLSDSQKSSIVESGARKKEDTKAVDDGYGKLVEIESVKEYGTVMEGMGLWNWWRKGMGYAREG